MTVKELIRELQTCTEDYEVMTWMRSGDIEDEFKKFLDSLVKKNDINYKITHI